MEGRTDDDQTWVGGYDRDPDYGDEDDRRDLRRHFSQTDTSAGEGRGHEQIEFGKVGEGGLKPVPKPRTIFKPTPKPRTSGLNDPDYDQGNKEPSFGGPTHDPDELPDLPEVPNPDKIRELAYKEGLARFKYVFPKPPNPDGIITGLDEKGNFAVKIRPEVKDNRTYAFIRLFNSNGSINSRISDTMRDLLGPTKWEIEKEEEDARIREQAKQQEEELARLREQSEQQEKEVTRLKEQAERREEERLVKIKGGEDPGPYEEIPLVEYRIPTTKQVINEWVMVYSRADQIPAGGSNNTTAIVAQHTGSPDFPEEVKDSIFEQIRDILPDARFISFNAFRDEHDRIWVLPKGDGPKVARPMMVGESVNRMLDNQILDDLGKTVAEKNAELDARREAIEKEVNMARERLVREDAVEGFRKDIQKTREMLEALNREAGAVEREQEDMDRRLSLRERLRQLFKRHGVTLFSLVTAVGIVLGTVLSTMGKGFSALAKGTAKALAQMAKKLAVALPGIIGTLVSTIFRAASSVVGFLAEHVWLLIAGLAVLFIEWLRSKGKRGRS